MIKSYDKIESEHLTQTCLALKELKTVKARQHKRQTKIMNSENAPKEIVKSFIDLASVAKGFINENQPPSAAQELRRLFPSTSGGRRGQSTELRVGVGELSVSATDATGNTTSFTTPTTKQTIEEIWGSKSATSKKPRKSNKTTSGKISHIVKDIFLIPDPSIKIVPRKKKRQDYCINNLVASAVKFHSMMKEKDIRDEIGRSFPKYDVTNFPELDFLKAVENIFVQPDVKEWDFKTIKHIYGQDPVYIRTWYCLNSKLVSAISRDPFSYSDDDMDQDSEDCETESNKCTGNFSHLKDLI